MEHLDQRIQRLLWPDTPPKSPLLAKSLVPARYAYALTRELLLGELSLRAMSLVYTTMLSVVPLLAFSFSVLKGLGIHHEIEPLLQHFLAPLGSRSDEISARLIHFVDNISGSVLASLSIAALLLTALSMAQIVESSMNFVWRVDRPRSLARRFSEYISVMLIGPLLMSIVMGLIATVSNAALMDRLRSIHPLGAWFAAIGEVTPYLLIIAAFTFLYAFVPNARVRFKAAVAGGVFAGILWAGGGTVFADVVAGASRNWQAVYSGFAIVLLAMFWLYLSWLILLLGAQLAYYVQYPQHLRLGGRGSPMSNALRERLALNVMLLVGRDFLQPGHGWRPESLAARIRIPRHQLQPIIGTLQDAGLLTQTPEQRLIPAKDPHVVQVIDILRAVRNPPAGGVPLRDREWDTGVSKVLSRLDSAIESSVQQMTLADLVDEDMAEQPAEAEDPAQQDT
jgi:membrane protein